MVRSEPRHALIGLVCVLILWGLVSCQRPSGTEHRSEETSIASSRTGGVPSGTSGHGALATIRKREEMRVGMQVGYVPFQMTDSQGRLVGFDVDMAHVVAKALQVGAGIERLGWQELIRWLLQGKIDLIMSGMTITPERNEFVTFTDPVLESGRMFLVHRVNAEKFKKLKDLDRKGIFIASVRGGLGDLQTGQLIPNASIREFPDRKKALEEVFRQRCHAYIDEEFTIRLACARHPELLIGRFQPLTYEPIAWAVRPGETHWRNWLNNLIRAMKKDGRLDELKRKWLRDYYLDLGTTAERG